MYLGDFPMNATVRHVFPSTNANGTPTALANGTVVVYKDGGTAEITANITLTASFDSRAGSNLFSANMSANTTNFSSGSDYSAVLTVGDVGGVSVANMPICSWSVENRNGFRASDRTLLGTINTNVNDIEIAGGGGGMQHVTLNIPYTHARVTPPLGSATVLSSLVSASPTNVTIATTTMDLILQAENGTIRYEIDGSNASQSSRALFAGQSISLRRKNANQNWFSSITVTQDSANSVNGTLRVDASNG